MKIITTVEIIKNEFPDIYIKFQEEKKTSKTKGAKVSLDNLINAVITL